MKDLRLLAIETSASACSIALFDGNKPTTEQYMELHEHAPMQQAQLLLPMLQKLLEAAELRLVDLHAIAYGCGPGSFTGIRLASSVAQGLAFGLDLPLIPVSSMAAMARDISQKASSFRSICVCKDARSESVYLGNYQVADDGHVELLGKEMRVKLNELNDSIVTFDSRVEFCGAGDGWRIYAPLLKEKLQRFPEEVVEGEPRALAVLQLALNKHPNKHLKNSWVTAGEGLLNYL